MNWLYLCKISTLILWRRMITIVRNFPLSILFLPVLGGILIWGLFLLRWLLHSFANVYIWPENTTFYGRLFGLWGLYLFLTTFFMLLWSLRNQKNWGQLASLPLFARDIVFGFYWFPFFLVNFFLVGSVAIPLSAIGLNKGALIRSIVFILWVVQTWGWALYALWGPWQQNRYRGIFIIVLVGLWHILPFVSFPFFLDSVHFASLLQHLLFEHDIFRFSYHLGFQLFITFILWKLVWQYTRTYPRLLFSSKETRWTSCFLIGNSLFEQIILNEGKRLWRSQDRRFFMLLVFLIIGGLSFFQQSSTEFTILFSQTLPLLIGMPSLGALSHDMRGEWILNISPCSRIRYLFYKLFGYVFWAVCSSVLAISVILFLFSKAPPSFSTWGFICIRILSTLSIAFLIEGLLRIQPEDLLGQVLLFSSYFIGVLTLDFSIGYLRGLFPWSSYEYFQSIIYLILFVSVPFLVWIWEETLLNLKR